MSVGSFGQTDIRQNLSYLDVLRIEKLLHLPIIHIAAYPEILAAPTIKSPAPAETAGCEKPTSSSGNSFSAH